MIEIEYIYVWVMLWETWPSTIIKVMVYCVSTIMFALGM